MASEVNRVPKTLAEQVRQFQEEAKKSGLELTQPKAWEEFFKVKTQKESKIGNFIGFK